MAYTSGIQNPFTVAGITVNPVYAFAVNFFANRTPLTARLPAVPEGADTFKITNDRFRPSSTTINEGGSFAQGDVTLTVTDGTIFQAGDVIEIESEVLLITAVSTNNLTVTRGYAGTTDAAHADATIVYVIGNTRTGGEVDVDGISYTPTSTTQYLQTIQHPWQVGGSLATNTAVALPSGVPNWVTREKMAAMQRVMDDTERAFYYGRAVARAATTTRPAMNGLRALLTTNTTTSPTNAAAYKPDDLIRDTIQKCYDGGGNPGILVVSSDFLTGFAVWGHAAMRLDAGANLFGTPIDVFTVPFLSGINVVPAPLLRPGSAICLTEMEVKQRIKRALYNKDRGSRGDAEEGDIITELAIEVENEAHHAYLSGVTAFSAA